MNAAAESASWCLHWAICTPQLSMLQILGGSANGLLLSLQPAPSWPAVEQLLQISHQELLAKRPLQLTFALTRLVKRKQKQQEDLAMRIDADQAALLLLEGEGVAADCVGIVAQYLNSDFEQQPYVSAYKLH